MAQVTVLGVGRMGGAVTRRLAAAGHEVTIWNRSRTVADRLAEDLGLPNLRVAASTPEAVADANFVICSLADGRATTGVLLDASLLDALNPSVIVCDMGTSGVATARALDDAFRERGIAFVDGPVSGSVATADAGQLLVLAGGTPGDVDFFRPIFAAYAKKVSHLGGAGSGQAMKLAVNLVVHDLNAALSEALLLATRAGIPGDDAYDVFQDSVIGSPFVNYKRAAFLDAATPVAMSLELVKKDLGLILEAAASLGVPAPTTSAVARAVADSCDAGYGQSDMATLGRFLATPSSS